MHGGVHFTLLSIQTSNYSGHRRPPPSRLGVWGALYKLLQRGLGPSPSRKRFGAFYVYMRFHASFSAFKSCLEMENSYTPVLASRSRTPQKFCRTPQLEFLGCPDAHYTYSGCATELRSALLRSGTPIHKQLAPAPTGLISIKYARPHFVTMVMSTGKDRKGASRRFFGPAESNFHQIAMPGRLTSVPTSCEMPITVVDD